MAVRTYTELLKLPTFEERFRYVSIGNGIGEATFGGRRFLNQRFYRSSAWKRVRDVVIIRDNGCDLAISERPILGKIMIHHLNPILVGEIYQEERLLDPEFLICVSYDTHNALHYGSEALIPKDYKPRFQNDTCPWRW